jgi:quercetin dioxygenase-like cupin family protein
MTDSLLGAFSIEHEIERYHPTDSRAGRRAETLIKTDGLRVVLVTMLAGITLHEHTAPGPITIHAVRGQIAVTFDDEQRTLLPGDLIALAPGVRHAVHTIEEGAFLLTIGWNPDAGNA